MAYRAVRSERVPSLFRGRQMMSECLQAWSRAAYLKPERAGNASCQTVDGACIEAKRRRLIEDWDQIQPPRHFKMKSQTTVGGNRKHNQDSSRLRECHFYHIQHNVRDIHLKFSMLLIALIATCLKRMLRLNWCPDTMASANLRHIQVQFPIQTATHGIPPKTAFNNAFPCIV